MQHSAIWMAGVYLMLLMQFLENKVAVDLTRTEFLEAQEVGYHLHQCQFSLEFYVPLVLNTLEIENCFLLSRM